MLDWFRHDIVDRGRLPLLCCLLAFLVTFLVTRSVVRYIHGRVETGAARRWWQPGNITFGSVHIHHVVFGVVLVMVAGVTLIALGADGPEPLFSLTASAFGIGAALVLDEYALILHLSDVYWEEDGRASVDAVFAATAVTGLLVLGFHPLTFLISLWRDTHSPLMHTAVFVSMVMALPLGVMVLLKGKVWTGLTGMFFFPLLLVGAIRLSRPHAPWARWRYHTRRTKMDRAVERERRLRRPVVRVKLLLQDVVAGRPGVPEPRVVEAELDREVREAAAPTVAFIIPRLYRTGGPPRPGPVPPVPPGSPAPPWSQRPPVPPGPPRSQRPPVPPGPPRSQRPPVPPGSPRIQRPPLGTSPTIPMTTRRPRPPEGFPR